MIGELVTHYRIIDKLGQGGMGVVYRAEDTRLGRRVAVKFLSARLACDAMAIERFQREARAASALNHPHICAIYDVGQHEERPFLVMELLDGRTLRDRISNRPLPIASAIDYAIQILDAIDAAHQVGIIHRDIKSANLYVTSRDSIKILDFGLAKLARHLDLAASPHSPTMLAAAAPETETGQMLGTLSSLSPEQARGEEVDPRTDLFSVGIVLFEMLTGREPFSGKTAALVFDAILHGQPRPPSELNTEVPAELDRIVARSLEKDRGARFQSAAEFATELRRLQRESLSATITTSASTLVQRPPAMPARGRRKWLIGTAAGVAVLVVAGLGVYSFLGTSSNAIESVAVLPFTGAGAGADTEYLTDGISETLINGLSQLPDLRVTSRSVAFRYKGKVEDTQQIGRDLDVRAVVTGRVTVRGDRLVIQAELMNVADGSQLWGDQYNRPASDLLTVQDEIAGEILNRIRPRLSGEDKKRVTKRSTENAAAYQQYLQGRYRLNEATIAGYRRAIDHFQQAIAMDANYAQAFAGLADAQLLLGSYWVETIPEAKASAEQALRLDPELADAHVSLGAIKLLLDWDWPAAEREFQQGITLAPASALAHNGYASYLAVVNRVPDAIAEVRRALQLDPLSPIVNSDLAWYQLYAGRPAEAVTQFGKALEIDVNSVSARLGLGIALSQQRRHEDAIRELRRALDLSEGSPVVHGHLGVAFAAAGRRADAEGALKQLEALSARQYVPSSAAAAVRLAMGDRTGALDLLDKAYDEHDFAIALIRVAPWFAALHNEDRFKALLEKLKLPR